MDDCPELRVEQWLVLLMPLIFTQLLAAQKLLYAIGSPAILILEIFQASLCSMRANLKLKAPG